MLNKFYNTLNKLFLLFLLIILSGCDDQTCIDPDDFGFPKYTIPSIGQNVQGEQASQYSEWKGTGLNYNGDKLSILVKNTNDDLGFYSKWTAWYGNQSGAVTTVTKDFPDCIYETLDMCPDPSNVPYNVPVLNAPCFFKKGMGLYLLITDPNNSSDPNSNPTIIKDPAKINAFTYHLGQTVDGGYPQTDTTMKSNGTMVTDSAGGIYAAPEGAHVDGELYFKILDRYYDDNSGYYKVTIKSGVYDPNPGPFTTVITMLNNALLNAAHSIYDNVIANNSYISAVKALLILYVSFLGILYAAGMVRMSHAELLAQMLKFAIVIQLIASESSWSFFYNYLFTFFIEGVNQISASVSSFITGGAPSQFAFFDETLNMFFSKETGNKIEAAAFGPAFIKGLSFSTAKTLFFGSMYTIMMYVIFILIAIAFFKAAIFYCLSMIAITMLITLAPVFITFMLFKFTKAFLDTWLKEFFSYSIQIIMVFASLTFFVNLILNQMYYTLGYGICMRKVWDILGVDFYYWQPAKLAKDNNGELYKSIIPVPKAYVKEDGTLCDPYQCTEERYISLPYLDPEKDENRVNQIKAGEYMTWNSIWLMFVLAYLMLKFNTVIPPLAKAIAGSGSFVAMDQLSNAAFQGLENNAAKLPYVGKAVHARQAFFNPTDLISGEDNTRYHLQKLLPKKLEGLAGLKIQDGMAELTHKARRSITPSFIKRAEDNALLGSHIRNKGSDAIGDKIQLAKDAGNMFLHNATNGMFGQDMNSKDFAHYAGHAFKLSQEQITALSNGIDDIKTQAKNKSGLAAAGASLVNPFAGAGFAAYYAYQLGKTAKKTYDNVKRSGLGHKPLYRDWTKDEDE